MNQQPIPPKQNSTAPVEPVAPATPVESTPAPATDTTPVPEVTQATDDVVPEQQQAQDQQVVEAVAQGLADEEITASDIMTAVLSDALGLSPAGAQSLFNLLMSEMETEETPEEPMDIQQPPME